jgi:hypothetical protein
MRSPFCHDTFKAFAMQSMNRACCIGKRRMLLLLLHSKQSGDEKTAKKQLTGKLALREAFPDAVSSGRRKDPIEVGSGSTLLGKPGCAFFKKHFCASSFDALQQRVLSTDGVVVRDLEHLCYYEAFKKQLHSGTAAGAGAAADKFQHDSKEEAADKQRLQKLLLARLPKRAVLNHNDADACIGCRFVLPSTTELFCRVCGAYPARGSSSAKSHAKTASTASATAAV